jgi:hypothetical protein
LSAVLILTIAALSLSVTPTVFSGRDQGSISEAAIRLSQNHQLAFSTPASDEFFRLYGTGKALNFPGFYYTSEGQLITHFPLAYTAWLGAFYGLAGISGLAIANAILFFIFLLSFYFLCRIFLSRTITYLAIAAAATSFSFFWFFKFTLSENMMLALLWFGIWRFAVLAKEKKWFNYFALLLPCGLMAFTRIEGFFILIAFAIAAAASKELRDFILSQKAKNVYFPAAVFLVFLAFVLAANFPFFKEIGKAILPGSSGGELNFWQKIILPAAYLIKVFYSYNILPFLILGAGGIILLIRKRDFSKLVPLLIISPTLVYFFDSHISSDHPWMLRRFVFSLLPAAIFYSFWLINVWREQKKTALAYSIAVILLILNLPLLAKYSFFSENKNVLAQTEKLSENFSAKDLVLVDRLASGDNWSMITGPMSFFRGNKRFTFSIRMI